MYKYTKKLRAERKQMLVNAFGGKCCICGYNRSLRALEFHHVFKKTFDIFGKIRKLDEVIEESKKCILVCSNCHKEIHDNIIKVSISMQNINEDIVNEYKNRNKFLGKEVKCICGKTFVQNHRGQKYCSIKCLNVSKITSKRPSKEELEDMVITKSLSEIGRIYNVTCTSVIKWCKKYGIKYKKDKIQEKKIKREIFRINYIGKNMTISEWSKELGIPKNTIRHRIDAGKPVEKVLSKK